MAGVCLRHGTTLPRVVTGSRRLACSGSPWQPTKRIFQRDMGGLVGFAGTPCRLPGPPLGAPLSTSGCNLQQDAVQTSSSNPQHSAPDTTAVRPFEEIPGPPGLPIVGTLFSALKGSGGFKTQSYLHEYFYKNQKKYGAIYREQVGSISGVMLADPEIVKELFRQDPKYPVRNEIKPWTVMRKEQNIPDGVFFADGPEWQKHRSALNRPMLRPRTVAEYTSNLNSVLADFLELFESRMQSDGEAPHIQDQLFHWSLESACFILFERRLGGLAENPPAEVDKFIKSTQGVFRATEKLLLVPPEIARALRLPVWKQLVSSMESLRDISTKYINERVVAVQQKQTEHDDDTTGLVSTLVQEDHLTPTEIGASVMDLMGASVDTTSNTALWTLYLLASNPEKQECLYKELRNALPADGVVTEESLRELPYLKAVLKEDLRLLPTAAFVSRTATEDMVLAGYKIPKGSSINVNLWAMRDDPKLYDDPTSFRPERWLRGSPEAERIHPFSSLPFGFGTRSCVGRRLAELEAYLLLARLVHKYRVELVTPEEHPRAIMRMLTVPDRAIRLRFLRRNL